MIKEIVLLIGFILVLDVLSGLAISKRIRKFLKPIKSFHNNKHIKKKHT